MLEIFNLDQPNDKCAPDKPVILSYDASGSSLTVGDQDIFKINSDNKITVDSSKVDVGEEKELYLYSENTATN